MSIPKKHSRRIIVNGHTYRWYIRHKPGYWNENFGGSLCAGIERTNPPSRRVLWFNAQYFRRDCMGGWDGAVMTPRMVEVVIQHALKTGWKPHHPGSAFECWFDEIDWPSYGLCPDGYYDAWCERNERRARAAAQQMQD